MERPGVGGGSQARQHRGAWVGSASDAQTDCARPRSFESTAAAAGLTAQIGTFKQLIVTSQRGPPASRHHPAKRRPIPDFGFPLPASSAVSRLVAPSRGSQTSRLGMRRPGETTAGSLDRPASGRPTDLSKRGIPTSSYEIPILLHSLSICQRPHLSRRL